MSSSKDVKYGRTVLPKKLYFASDDTTYVKLKNKLVFDGIPFSVMMRMIIDGYLNDDTRIMDYVSEKKEEKSLQSYPRYRKISLDQKTKAAEIHKKFVHGLSEEELEKIYDFIEGDFYEEEFGID